MEGKKLNKTAEGDHCSWPWWREGGGGLKNHKILGSGGGS